MDTINEARLPGIGRKIWLETGEGSRISIIVYNSGEYEIYLTPKGEEFPTSAVHLTEAESRALGGAFPMTETHTGEGQMPLAQCVVVPDGSSVLGQNAGTLKYGDAFVAAVESMASGGLMPPGRHQLQISDILHLMGPEEDRRALALSINPNA
ncbi:MAG TPA: hypothetical protein VJ961_10365 [Mariprofundaceae bacterium]|nr:hypothetical protein [Mariprofundaceae bacterium]